MAQAVRRRRQKSEDNEAFLLTLSALKKTRLLFCLFVYLDGNHKKGSLLSTTHTTRTAWTF